MPCSHAERAKDCSRLSCWELFLEISSLISDYLEGRARLSTKPTVLVLCCPGKRSAGLTRCAEISSLGHAWKPQEFPWAEWDGYAPEAEGEGVGEGVT